MPSTPSPNAISSHIAIRPDWLCEIVSESNRMVDTVTKLRRYHQAGVPHYWLLDPRSQALEPHHLNGGAYEREGVFGPGTTYHPPLFPGLQIVIDEIWA